MLAFANEVQDLHYAREGAEVQYWTVYRDQVSPELWTSIEQNASAYEAGDFDAGSKLMGLQPFANRSGSLGEFDGQEFKVGDQGIRSDITNTPTVYATNDGRVAVDLPLTITAYADNGKTLSFSKNQVLYMAPAADGRWVLDAYNPMNQSAVEVG